MITFTEKAALKALEIAKDEGVEEQFLRVAIRGGGCSGFAYEIFFDDTKEIDRHFEFYGLKVVVDEMSLMYVAGTEVDYVEELMSSGFKFNNPNVTATCGCGSSFSV